MALPAAALAHPLGNFTINHLAKVRVDGAHLHVRYVLDIAEIPTFQIMRERSSQGAWNGATLQAWADAEVERVRLGLHVEADGKRLALTSLGAHARLRPGAGGLPILYWTDDLVAELTPSLEHRIAIADRVYQDRRIGWKDITIGPQTEPTRELQVYPSAAIASPRAITSASFVSSSAGLVSQIRLEAGFPTAGQNSTSLVRQTLLSEMFLQTDQGPFWILITMLAAFAFGTLHAIEPGHGKALLAFTLVGARATSKQAAILALSLTFAHTIGVIAFGIVLSFATAFVPETIYPWITLVSGVAIAIVGGRALIRCVRSLQPFAHAHAHAHPHAHPHEHAHEHGYAHEVDHGHSHAIPGTQPLNFGSAVWAALSGGVAPCPAAIILLIAAVNSHRIGYGLVLIVIFGFGLAAVLTGLGLAVVHGAAWIASSGKYQRVAQYGPLASAALISIVGSVLLGQGFVQVGIDTNVAVVALLTLAAIAGSAFGSHRHQAATQSA